MIDRPTEDEPQAPTDEMLPEQDEYSEPPGTDPGQGLRFAAVNNDLTDLYSDLFKKKQATSGSQTALAENELDAPALPLNELRYEGESIRAPQTLAESGLSLMQLCNLVLKQLYLQGSALGIDLSRSTHLPFSIIDEALIFLKEEKCIEVSSGKMIGRSSYRFNLTELGRIRAREAFEQCRYVGPAPVTLEAYVKQCRLQTVTGIDCTPEKLQAAFSEFIIREGLLDELGPAVCSGRSIFIYGPPGNGKTLIDRKSTR